jgi:hypothetical protein
MCTTSVGQLPLSSFLSCAAQSAYVIDELQTGTLISLGQLCDDDVTAFFKKTAVNLLKNNKIIITGTRLTNGLWSIPLATSSVIPTLHQANGILRLDILKSYSDQTGLFPIPSSRGNHYMFILYHQDTNTIHAIGIPNRKGPSIRDAWETTHHLLVQKGHAPELHILDNECSQDLKNAFLANKIAFQCVPPHVHRVNAAERAIRTFKNHFIASLCTVDTTFPMTEWDRLLPQATLTLNLPHSPRIHPSLSAHASLHGNFDYNRTPIAPIGTRVIAHVTAEKRKTFGASVHGDIGWYIGPSLEHYRCYKCYL